MKKNTAFYTRDWNDVFMMYPSWRIILSAPVDNKITQKSSYYMEGGEKDMYYFTGLLGAALIISPFFFGYGDNTLAFWSSIVFGAGVILMSVMEGLAGDKDLWEYYVVGILGLGAVIAPFALGFGASSAATLTSVVAGILISLLAASRIYIKRT